jgi:hypothetical protein
MSAETKPDLRLEIAHVLLTRWEWDRSVKTHGFRKSLQDRNQKQFTNNVFADDRNRESRMLPMKRFQNGGMRSVASH